ncbi:MAG: tetraacyldisaccharide 4'-kinase [Candidatus Edwardsbacteria bacterium]|jgi:tetraacyldisaccharide 4'-kinase|nr:tetraacyldisaccharide 4'-kinase [Candidatus Edwardsbacteria bacterium]
MKVQLPILFLWPLAAVYGAVVRFRTEFYRRGWLRAHATGIPVISIGNITAGGTGKTPMAIHVAQLLLRRGLRVAVLSRGYKRTIRNPKSNILVVSDGVSMRCAVDQAGDEPYLMASRLLGSAQKPGAFVIVGKDRVAGAKMAVELGAQAIVLDDGFQHLRLRRDLDIVLLDAGRPLGSGWLLPAGRLREPAGALGRASALVFTRAVAAGRPTGSDRLAAGKPAFASRHVPAGLFRWRSNTATDPAELAGKRVLLFSGIARPESFERSAGELGVDSCGHLRFGDHHGYSDADLGRIAAAASSGDALVTTEKDAVRLPLTWGPGKPLYVLRIGIEFVKDAERFEQLVLSAVGKSA